MPLTTYNIVIFLIPIIGLAQRHQMTAWLLDRGYHIYKYLLEDQFRHHLPKLIRRGDLVVDVGANIGFYTAIFSKLVGSEGRVLAIDPCREHCRKLAALGLNNVTVFEQAAGAVEGEIDFYLNLRHPGDHRCYFPGPKHENVVKSTAHVSTLSRILRKQSGFRVSLIKIDVQGFEMAVLEGLEEWMTATGEHPNLILEVAPTELNDAKISVSQIEEWLRGHGYHLFRLQRDGVIPLENLSHYILVLPMHDYFDILASPRMEPLQ
ncbi:MAG: FkbM family methyltransferase [Candidatus Electrothrix gigas]